VLVSKVRREPFLDPCLKWPGDVCCGEGVGFWEHQFPLPLV
jgi:hypothetical protein